MTGEAFGEYGHFYDLLYRDKDYATETGYVVRLLHAAVPGARHLLEFGSGTGRHARFFAREGFDVVGVERSQSMIAAARTANADAPGECRGGLEWVQGDIRIVELHRVFDAVLALFHVVSYQTTDEDLRQTFENAARHLRPRGVFVFDVWHGPAVVRSPPAVRVKHVENAATRVTRIAEPERDTKANVVTVVYTILAVCKSSGRLTTIKEAHRVRYLFPSDIGRFADQTGFDVERTEESLTGRKPSEASWGVTYMLRRRE